MTGKRKNRPRKRRRGAPDSVRYYCMKCKRRIDGVTQLCQGCKRSMGYEEPHLQPKTFECGRCGTSITDASQLNYGRCPPCYRLLSRTSGINVRRKKRDA